MRPIFGILSPWKLLIPILATSILFWLANLSNISVAIEEEQRLKSLQEQKTVDERFGVKKPGDFKERAIEAIRILEKRVSDAAVEADKAEFNLPPSAAEELISLLEGIKDAVRDEQFSKGKELTQQLYDRALAIMKQSIVLIPPDIQIAAEKIRARALAAFEAKDLLTIGDIAKDLSKVLVIVKGLLKSKTEAETALKDASEAIEALIIDADRDRMNLPPERLKPLKVKLAKAKEAAEFGLSEDAKNIAQSLLDDVEQLREELKLLRDVVRAKEKAVKAAEEAREASNEVMKEFEALTMAEGFEETIEVVKAIKRAAENAQEAAKRAIQRAEEARKRALERKLKDELLAANEAEAATDEALKHVETALENALKAAELAAERAKRQLQEIIARLEDRREVRASVDSTNSLIIDVRVQAQKAADNATALAKRLAEAVKRAEERVKVEPTQQAKIALEMAIFEAKKAELEAKRIEKEARKKALEAAKEVSQNAKVMAELAAKVAAKKAEKAEKEPPKSVQKLAREVSVQLEEAKRRFEEAKLEFDLAQKHFIELKRAAIEARKVADATKDSADIAAAEEAEKLAQEAQALAKAAEVFKDEAEAAKNQAEEVTVKVSLKATDTDGDGKITIFDLVIVATIFGEVGPTEQLGSGDIDGNGEVNIFDIVLAALGFAGEKVIIPPTEIELKAEGIIVVKATQVAPALEPMPMQYASALKFVYEALKAQPNPTPELQKTIALLEQLIWGKTTSTSRIVVKNQLLQNYPNPFNPETWIPFELSQSAKVNISIYNALGQLVRVMDLGQLPSGSYVEKNQAAYWDGRNSSGDKVSSGVYFYSIKAGSYVATKKMIVVK